MSQFGDVTVIGRVTQTLPATADNHLIRKGEAAALVTAAVTSVNGSTGVVVLETDDIAEPGSPTNQWFTGARARATALTGFSATTGAITAADTVLTLANKTQGRLVAIEAWTTDNLAQGATNKYYSDAQVRACVLTGFVATTGAITAADTVLTLANKTQGRLAAIEAWTTANVAEGANLYYTDARARAAITGTSPVVIASGVVSVQAASANTVSYLVQRDGSGDFASRKIVLGTAAAADHLTLGTTATLGYVSSALTTNVAFKATEYLLGTTHKLRVNAGAAELYAIDEAAVIFSAGGEALTVTQLKLEGLTGVLKMSAGIVVGDADTDDLPEGSANVYFTNARADTRADVRIAAVAGAASGLATLGSDSKLTAAQLPASVVGAANYQGTWNATTNSPALASSTGTKGYYYVVSTAGTTNLDGVTTWAVGDWAIFNGTVWQKVDNTDSVTSVNTATGAVVLTTANVSEVTNLYFTEGRVLGTDLTGLTPATGTIVGGDTILDGFGKTQGRLAAIEAWSGGTFNVADLTVSAGIGVGVASTYDAILLNADGSATFANASATPLSIDVSGNLTASKVIIAPAASTSGTPTLLTITGPAHTTLAASVEAADVYFNLNRIVQFATGALTTQRAVRISNPKYAFAGASTLGAASTVEIGGAPVAHTNATITAAYALKIAAGALNSDVTVGTSLYVDAPTGAGANYCAVFASGNVGIGTAAPTKLLDINGDTVRLRTARTPASAAATGAAGEICWDASYVYVCVATDTWKRAAIATW